MTEKLISLELPIIGEITFKLDSKDFEYENIKEKIYKKIFSLNSNERIKIIKDFDEQMFFVLDRKYFMVNPLLEKKYSFENILIEFNCFDESEINANDICKLKKHIKKEIVNLFGYEPKIISFIGKNLFIKLLYPAHPKNDYFQDLFSIFTFEKLNLNDENKELYFFFTNDTKFEIPIIKNISFY